MATLLSTSEVEQALATLADWTQDGKELVKEFSFKQYLDGVAFASRLGQAAEAANHHPDMIIGWRRVTVRISTHSAGGLTAFDFALAQRAEELAAP